jgi:phosphoadenosine phosphosulfate reductase
MLTWCFPLARWSSRRWTTSTKNTTFPSILHGRGYPSIGCATCTTPIQPGEDARAGRWRHIRQLLESKDEKLYCKINWVDQKPE